MCVVGAIIVCGRWNHGLTWGMGIAISRVHAGHRAKLVRRPFFLRRDELTCLPCSRFSFPLPDIERTLDVMAWVHVRNRLICFIKAHA